MEYSFNWRDNEYRVDVDQKEGTFIVRIGDRTFSASAVPISENVLSLLIGSRSLVAHQVDDGTDRVVILSGRTFRFSLPDRMEKQFTADATRIEGKQVIKSPMPGRVVKVLVEEGQKVQAKQSCVILEAMKMENELGSVNDGIVTKVEVVPDQLVEANTPLIVIEAASANSKP